MEIKRLAGLRIISLVDYILVCLFIFPAIIFYAVCAIASKSLYAGGWGLVAMFFWLAFYLPSAIWLIISANLLRKYRKISVPLHILYYSFFGFIGLLKLLYFMFRISIFPFFKWIRDIDLMNLFFVVFTNPLWISVRIMLSMILPVVISITIIIYLTRPIVKEQFKQ